MSNDSLYLFRGDQNYRWGDDVGKVPFDPARKIAVVAQSVYDHVRQRLHSSVSEITSWTKSVAIARIKFAASNKKAVLKAEIAQLEQLRDNGQIMLYAPSDVLNLLKNSGVPKLRKQANAIQQDMAKNAEILIEGIIPAVAIQRLV